GRLRQLGWICVLCLWLAAPVLAQESTAPAAPGGEAPPPPLQPVTPQPPPLQPVTPQPPAVKPVQPAAAAPAAAPAAQPRAAVALDDEVAADVDEPDEATRAFDEDLRFRAQNTWLGPTGGFRIVDASSGPAGTARLQFGFEYFSASEFLYVLDQNENLGGALSLSVTPIEHLEAYASLSTHANSNTAGDPVLLQVAGDVILGAKGFAQVLPWLGVGGDVRLLFLNTIGDLGVIIDGTSVGFRGAATADLRRLREPLPLIVRGNIEYLLDNSAKLVEGVENARYEALALPMRKDFADEDRQLVTRIERFALGINRVDMLSFGIGVEAPFQVTQEFFLQPLLEFRLGVPVNRQGYSCLAVTTTASIDGDDSCLAIEGLSAAPSALTLGLRVLPPLRGLSALVAFDIGLSGTSTFVRELAPNRPWAFMMTVGYAIDARPPKPQIQYVSAPAAAPKPELPKTRLRGVVVERGFNTAIVGAIVRYPDLDLSPQLTNVEGRFVSYGFDPGEINLEVSHPDYDPGRCAASIPAVAPPPAARPEFIEVRCELNARPRSGALRGSVRDDKNAPVPATSISIAGPSPQTVVSDAAGSFTLSGLPVGEYTASVDVPGYLLKSQSFSVAANSETNVQLVLVAKPKEASVTLTAKEVKIRNQIMFKSSSAEIDERSSGLLSEIADVLLRNPQVTHVQVQGHTDNVGDPEANLQLSQQRAEAVVAWLVGAGVASDRLEAKGYGDARPLVPNLTAGNRARNRRVQFIVKDQ
ncbi:MAG TPA: OmpA family protein, partial [Polyangiales bacterium]|nr:OmpA family protein [Polyangiales bacterium]